MCSSDLHRLELQKGDTFYIFSDGFADQFGGEKGKKLKSQNFKNMLLSIQDKSMRSEERRVGKECRSRWSPYH